MSLPNEPTSLPAAPISLTVLVCTPSGTPIPDADVKLTSPSRATKTRSDGIAYVTLTEDEFKALLLDDQTIPNPTKADPNATASIKSGGVTFSIEKSGYGPMADPGSPVAAGPVSLTTAVWSNTGDFGDGAPMVDRLRIREVSNGKNEVVLRRTLVVPMALEGTGKGQETPDTPVRRLTIDEAHHELVYHDDHGYITLLPASKYTQDAAGNDKPPSKQHPGLAQIVGTDFDPKENVLVETQPMICGVTFLAVINFPSGPSITWAPLPKLVLNFRHAVALVRLCRFLYGMGYRIIYTAGINADDNRNDCHGWGRAIDLSGVATEMPQPKDPSQKQKFSAQRLGKDFIVLYDWGKVDMWDRRTTSRPEEKWERLGNVDDEYDYVANLDHHVLKYRMKPADRFKIDGKDVDKLVPVAHLVTASTLFKDIYDFVVEQYSDGNSQLGPLKPNTPETSTPIDSHKPGLIFHPDYAYWNQKRADLRKAYNAETDPVKKKELQKQKDAIKNDREPHNNHYHIQLGKTNAPRK